MWAEESTLAGPLGAAKFLAGRESSGVLLTISIAGLSLLLTEPFLQVYFSGKKQLCPNWVFQTLVITLIAVMAFW